MATKVHPMPYDSWLTVFDIVFTQYICMAEIFGTALDLEQIPFLYYAGDMSDTQKTRNLGNFRTDKKIKILVGET